MEIDEHRIREIVRNELRNLINLGLIDSEKAKQSEKGNGLIKPDKAKKQKQKGDIVKKKENDRSITSPKK